MMPRVLLAVPAVARAETDSLPRPAIHADPGIPSPAQFLGRPVEENPMDGREILGYARRLAQSSRRVVLHVHGKSVEGRALFHLVIGDPAHLEDLPALKRRNAALAGLPAADVPPVFLDEMPVTVWLAGAVHGDEHSSAEALLQVAYDLAADRSESRQRQLKRLTVIIEPVQNPDGRARFLAHLQIARFGDSRADPEAWEHQQDWPGGRGNHFFFDLNRDWFFLTQPESRARAAAFLAWRPQVVADFHEMSGDSTYYFAPPGDPVHPLVPASIRRLWTLFGEDVAAALDRRGTPYFRRDRFDLFYPGYGDSWPSLNGAVGLTYEQASARGWRREARDGRVLTLGRAMGNHLTAALALLDSAAAHRRELLAMVKEQQKGRETVLPAASVQAVYIPAHRFPLRVSRLERRLRQQGIPAGRLMEPIHLAALHAYGEEGKRSVDLAAGTLVVPARGPARRLVAALFAPDEPFSEAFLTSERRRLLNGQRGRIFDVTAWSLPLVLGLDAFWSRHPVSARLGVMPPAETPLERAKAAYLLPGGGLGWDMAVGFLLDRHVQVGVSRQPVAWHGTVFPPGAAVVRVPGNDPEVHTAVQKAGEAAGVCWRATDSFGAGEGVDLGSEEIMPLRPVRLAVLTGAPVSPSSFGAVADLLVNGTHRPFTPLPLRRLGQADLRRYQVLVLPDGDADAYAAAVDKQALMAVRAFVRSGGVLVAIK
ncbi:MAG: M14 family zinc carboxypeptidase, partial [Acidobacteriota bacterium]